MILFPLIASWIWLQAFTSATFPKRKLALVPGVRPKAKQDRPDDDNPIQYDAAPLRHSQAPNEIDLVSMKKAQR